MLLHAPVCTPVDKVVVQRRQLRRCLAVEQARELGHPALAVPHERLLQRPAVDAQEAHVGGAVLALRVRARVCVGGGARAGVRMHTRVYSQRVRCKQQRVAGLQLHAF